MFKNRELHIRMSKTPKNDDPATIEEHITNATSGLDKEIAMDLLKRTAVTVGCVIVGLKVLDILGEIAVKKTKSADKE